MEVHEFECPNCEGTWALLRIAKHEWMVVPTKVSETADGATRVYFKPSRVDSGAITTARVDETYQVFKAVRGGLIAPRCPRCNRGLTHQKRLLLFEQ